MTDGQVETICVTLIVLSWLNLKHRRWAERERMPMNVEHLKRKIDEVEARYAEPERLRVVETMLEHEYAEASGLEHRPGMLRLVANSIVLKLLVGARVRNLITVELMALALEDEEAMDAGKGVRP